jgi:hypothetical protein
MGEVTLMTFSIKLLSAMLKGTAELSAETTLTVKASGWPKKGMAISVSVWLKFIIIETVAYPSRPRCINTSLTSRAFAGVRAEKANATATRIIKDARRLHKLTMKSILHLNDLTVAARQPSRRISLAGYWYTRAT